MDWWRSAWRLKLDECRCKYITLLMAVASLCRYPDAIACLVVCSIDRDGLVEVSVEIKIRWVHMQIYSTSHSCSKSLPISWCHFLWLRSLWTETDWWRSVWRLKLGECTCKSIPLLIPVARLCRYPDAISSGWALSGPRRIGGSQRGD